MTKVIVQYNNTVKFYENVSKVQFLFAGGALKSKLVIYRGVRKTVIETCEINGFEIK